MGFALFAFSSLYQPLRRIAVSMRAQPARHGLAVPAGATYPVRALAGNDPRCVAPAGHDALQATPHRTARAGQAQRAAGTAQRPLRVILSRHEGQACRLVISGRMADVCAELDRLALH
ncbi:MAG: hypothetical protein JSS19_17970 [Proteobacteria bacterium]|nr:hypothetical protein [Pseudomonadota bacterium]